MSLMEALNARLVELLGPLGPLIIVGALGVALIVITLVLMPKAQKDPLEKLKNQSREPDGTVDKTNLSKLREADKAEKLEKFATFLEPQNEDEMTSARLKMLQAGYRSRNAVRTFHAAQFTLGMAGLTLGLLYALLMNATRDISTSVVALLVIVPGLAGYYLPRYLVERRRQTRQQQIVEGFPDALDLMLVCVEAGQSMDQSILRVAREMRAGYPALAEEFEMVAQEIKAGKDRATVLRDMSDRCGVPDIASFVTVLVQSAQFGTSISAALRVFAGEMRDKRVMRAEEKANVLPTKLTLGTMLFTVPPLLIILIGPSVMGISTVLGGN